MAGRLSVTLAVAALASLTAGAAEAGTPDDPAGSTQQQPAEQPSGMTHETASTSAALGAASGATDTTPDTPSGATDTTPDTATDAPSGATDTTHDPATDATDNTTTDTPSGATDATDTDTALGPCDSDIDFNEVIACTVSNPNDVRDLSFSASAGDKIRVRVVATGGAVNPLVSVRKGATVVCADTFADEFTCPLTSNGAHTLRINANGSGTGSYSTTIQRLNDPVGCASIPYGTQGKTGSLSKGVELDCFTHDADADERWLVRTVETGGSATLLTEVVRPDGTTVCGPSGSTDLTCLLDANGDHRVIVRDSSGLNTGSYRVVVERFPQPTGCIDATLGKTTNVKVQDAGAIACVTFPASLGGQARVRVVATGGAWNPLVEVRDASGAVECAQTFGDEFTCPLTSGGKHTVVIGDGGGTGQSTGQAAVFVQRADDPAGCVDIDYGPTGSTGSIGANAEIDCYTHDATAGQLWFVRVVETGGSTTLLQEVVRPDGTSVCGLNGSTELSCLLTANGAFRVFVQDSTGLNTGSYRVVLERFPGPSGCTAAAFDTTKNIKVTKAGAMSCLTFPGSSGDDIRVRVIATGGAWNPLAQVLRADGSTVCFQTFADEFTCSLTTNGQHTLLVADGGGTGQSTGNAAVYVQRLNDPIGCATIKYGPTGRTGSIAKSAEMDCFTQDAKAGDRWIVHVVETDGTATLLQEVVRPDGSTVCGLNGNIEMTCLLDANGPFRVYVQDSTGLATGSYRVVVQRFPKPSGCANAEVGGAIVHGEVNQAGAIDCATFTGSAGDNIRVRVVSTGGTWNPLAEVVRTDGSTVCFQTFADEFTCALTTNGKHTVLVSDGVGTGSSTGTYTLELDEV